MTQFRIIFRVLSNGSWESETIKAIDKETAKSALLEVWGDDPVRIVSATQC